MRKMATLLLIAALALGGCLTLSTDLWAAREFPSKLEAMARNAVAQSPEPEVLEAIQRGLLRQGLRLLPETSMKFATGGDDVFVIELENPLAYLEERGYVQESESVEATRGFSLYVDRGVVDSSEEPIVYLAFLAKRTDDPLPSILLVAGTGVVGFDLSGNRAVILREPTPLEGGGVAPQFDLGDVPRLGSCFLDFLGLSSFDDIDDLVGNFCQLSGQTREAYEIAVGLSACIDLTVLPSNLGCYLSLAMLARFVGCGINDIVQCIEAGPSNDPCTSSVPFNTTVQNAWASSCPSTHRSGRYARYFTFTLNSPANVQIDLQASADTYLYLLQGHGRQGSVITADDDSGPGLNSRIIRSLPAGSYTVEATTFSSGVTGGFSISVAVNAATSDCFATIAHNSTVSSSWTSACASAHRSGRYAKYYTFTLNSAANIQIDVQSSTDTYVYLLAGSGSQGSVLAFDDDGGSGLNSRITGTAQPGTYTIEATTYSPGRTGSFQVSLSVAGSTASCFSAIPFNTSVNGTWTSQCASAHRSGAYARYYTFSLTSSATVTINLTSSEDTYLYLLNGNGSSGSVVTFNDDGGTGLNSRIVRTLAAGTYTVEATTFRTGRTGNFVISVAR